MDMQSAKRKSAETLAFNAGWDGIRPGRGGLIFQIFSLLKAQRVAGSDSSCYCWVPEQGHIPEMLDRIKNHRIYFV